MIITANLKQAKTQDEVKRLTVNDVKKAYNELALDYNHLLNLDFVYCPKCGKWKSVKSFYGSTETVDGVEHFACKECILDLCTDVSKDGIRTDNRQKTIDTFRRLNWYFNEKDYRAQMESLNEGTGEKIRSTAVQQIIVMIRSLPNWRGLTYADSDFGIDDTDNNSEENTKIVQKTLKNAKKRFGQDYTNEQLMYLEEEYQDWITRYECNTKAQEEIFKNLSTNRLERKQAVKQGKPTKEIDKTFQELLAAQNIQPRQSGLDTFSDAQTMGTLIQKYEETRPLPDIDPELSDVDKIGLYIDAFYRGHASKMLGLKNRFSNIYEKVMSKYAVKPPSYDEESDSEILFDKIFGSQEE